MHLIGQNKHSKFTCNTLRILPVTMTCAVLCWQTYLGMYSSAFCHIWALKKAFKKQNNGQSVPKIWVLSACIWLARTNTQHLHAILYIFCLWQWLAQCCADKPPWGHIPQLFATFEPWRRHLRRVTSAKGSQKSECYMYACIWLARTNRQNWVQYFPCKNDLCRAMLPDCLGTLSSSLCQISALKEAIG